MEKSTTVGSQKIAVLFDAGTFVETGAYIKRADGSMTGVVCGYGAIGGKLVYAFAQDSDREGGAFDAKQAEKIEALYAMALRNGAPVVGIFDSVGAMIREGAGVMSGYGRFLKAVSDASGVIPQIAVITGICSGLSATVATMFDLTVTVKEKAQLFVGAPFLLGKNIGTAEYVAANGLSSMTAAGEDDAYALVRELVTLLPANSEEGVALEEITDDINRTVAVEGLSAKEMIQSLTDGAKLLEVGDAYAPEMLTGFAVFGGVTCGIVANNDMEKGGVITADAAKKAAKFVGLCDSFSIPVITLVNSAGVEQSAAAEGTALAAQLGKLAISYAAADTAKITVIVGKAYGASFTLMGSKALGADMVLALPDATVSVMDPAAAVAFLWNGQITENVTRADLEEKWIKEVASPEAAAADGAIDDVIEPAELRQRICAAVYMLLMKNSGAPARKHPNLPL